MNRGWLPPVGSGPGIWVTQPLTPTGEKTKNGVGGSRGPSGLVLLCTAPKNAAFTGVSDFRRRFVNPMVQDRISTLVSRASRMKTSSVFYRGHVVC